MPPSLPFSFLLWRKFKFPTAGNETGKTKRGDGNSKPEMKISYRAPSARRKGVSRQALPCCARPCPVRSGRGAGGVFQQPMREGHPDEQNQQQKSNRKP